MKRFLYLFAFVASNVFAQIPQTLSYQGLLTNSTGDNAGSPIADGSHTVIFNFYTSATATTKVESRTVTVTTFQGLFTTIIGNTDTPNQPLNTLNPPLGSTQYFVGLQVDGGVELTPRIALTAVPYAFAANTAYSLANTATVSGSQLNSHITTFTTNKFYRLNFLAIIKDILGFFTSGRVVFTSCFCFCHFFIIMAKQSKTG
jgi:hypothetical protein